MADKTIAERNSFSVANCCRIELRSIRSCPLLCLYPN